MTVYAIIHEFENPETLGPPTTEMEGVPVGRVVYEDAFSALQAAAFFRESLLYGDNFSFHIMRVHEVDACWEDDTTELPPTVIDEDWPEGLESAVQDGDYPPEGRYLTRVAKVGKMVKIF